MAGYLMRVKPLDWLQKQYKIKFDERKWKHNLANAGRRREQDDFITDYVQDKYKKEEEVENFLNEYIYEAFDQWDLKTGQLDRYPETIAPVTLPPEDDTLVKNPKDEVVNIKEQPTISKTRKQIRQKKPKSESSQSFTLSNKDQTTQDQKREAISTVTQDETEVQVRSKTFKIEPTTDYEFTLESQNNFLFNPELTFNREFYSKNGYWTFEEHQRFVALYSVMPRLTKEQIGKMLYKDLAQIERHIRNVNRRIAQFRLTNKEYFGWGSDTAQPLPDTFRTFQISDYSKKIDVEAVKADQLYKPTPKEPEVDKTIEQIPPSPLVQNLINSQSRDQKSGDKPSQELSKDDQLKDQVESLA